MSFTPEQTALLNEKLNKADVKTRSQAGHSFPYIEAWKATAECNAVFGFDAWDHEVADLRLVMERERKVGRDLKDGWGVSYLCRVRVTVRAGEHIVIREGVGSGHGVDVDLGQAHESAAKEAESDALKRALKSFGWRFGLALYDKDQEHVEAKNEAAPLIAQIAGMTTSKALDAWYAEYEDSLQNLSTDDYNAVARAFKTKKAELKAAAQ